MSIEKDIYIIFDVLMNILTFLLIVRVFFSLPGGHVKKSLISISLSYLTWFNLILVLRLVDFSHDEAKLIVKILLSSAVLMVNSLLYLFLALAGERELMKKRNLIFPVNAGFLILLNFLEMTEVPYLDESGRYVPEFRAFFPYFAITLFLTGAYAIYSMYRTLKNITDEFTLFQYKYIFNVSVITVLALTISQVVLPILIGKNIVTFYSNFIWPAFFIVVVLQLLVRGRILFMQSVYKDLIEFPEFLLEKNMMHLRKLIYAIKRLFEGSHSEIQKSLVFELPGNKKYSINITGKNGAPDDRWLIPEAISPAKCYSRIAGLMDVIIDMENENKRLSRKIIKYSSLSGENNVLEQIDRNDSGILPVMGSLNIQENIKNHKKQCEENKKIFGEYLVGRSLKFYEFLDNLRLMSKSTQAVMFYGESGTGKSLFSRAMHYYRKGGDITEFSCFGRSSDDIKETIHGFLQKSSKKIPGIIVRHIDAVKPEDFGIFETLLADFQGERFVYFTASNDIQMSLDGIKSALKNRFNQIQIQTIPLREMKEDIVQQAVCSLKKYTDEECGGFKYFDPKFFEIITNYDWPGNSYELNNAIRKAAIINSPPMMKNIQLGSEQINIPDSAEGSKLSPLEESEKIIIARYLKKNDYNKSKTKRELKITINTLNSKMKRYGIEMPVH